MCVAFAPGPTAKSATRYSSSRVPNRVTPVSSPSAVWQINARISRNSDSEISNLGSVCGIARPFLSMLLEIVRCIEYLLGKRILVRPPGAVDAQRAVETPVGSDSGRDVDPGCLNWISGDFGLDRNR